MNALFTPLIASSRLVAAACALLLVLLSSCGPQMDERPPMPVMSITLPAQSGVVIIDGQSLSPLAAQSEIQRRADVTRRTLTGNARMIARIQFETGGNAALETDVVNWCQRAGINLIERNR